MDYDTDVSAVDDAANNDENYWKVGFARLPSPPHLVSVVVLVPCASVLCVCALYFLFVPVCQCLCQWSETHRPVVALSLLPHLIIVIVWQSGWLMVMIVMVVMIINTLMIYK